jgi:hypothetical protein
MKMMVLKRFKKEEVNLKLRKVKLGKKILNKQTTTKSKLK